MTMIFLNVTSKGHAAIHEKLQSIRKKIVKMEKHLMKDLKAREKAGDRLEKSRNLLQLYGKEKKLAQKRLNKLKSVISDLKLRRKKLMENIKNEKEDIHGFLVDLKSSMMHFPKPFLLL